MLRLEFASLKEFKEVILEYNVLIWREIKFDFNDKRRARTRCKHCTDYLVYVSKIGQTDTYRLSTLQPKHTCGRVFNNKRAKSTWIAKVLIKKMKATYVDMSIKDITGDIRANYSTGITSSRAWRAKKLAKQVVDGDFVQQYSQLWSYVVELKDKSPINSCLIRVERPSIEVIPRFGSFYMCLEGPKTTFKKACKPLIGVDGCHLKSKFGGQLLIVIGRDPNDQYMPIAFVVIEIETKETWRWFLNLLFEDIGSVETNK
ncbi:hypothetical protein HKD37_10G027573 [Glycine soja]